MLSLHLGVPNEARGGFEGSIGFFSLLLQRFRLELGMPVVCLPLQLGLPQQKAINCEDVSGCQRITRNLSLKNVALLFKAHLLSLRHRAKINRHTVIVSPAPAVDLALLDDRNQPAVPVS